MTLTARERRRLRRIEAVLMREDPDLAARLRLGVTPEPRRQTGRRVLVGSLLILVVGSLLRQPPVCVIGWLGLTAGTLLAYA